MDRMNKQQGRPTITDEWGSFIAVPTLFVKTSKPLTDKARWLFVLLREYTNGESGVAFPSYDTIRERTGWGRSQISNAIKCLEKHGWLSRQHQFGGVTLYRLMKPVEPNSTETKLLEAPKTAIANNPKLRRQKSQTETPIVPNRDAIKIETTKIEINKIDICESQVEPFDSLANDDAQIVHAQPLTLEVPNLTALAKGKVEFFSVEVDGNTKTVHANGGSATPPEYAPVPPSAQAAVIAPTPNAQLRVLSPLAESTGITASIEAVDQPSAPVSVEKRKTSRKAKTAKTDSPEEIQRKADHKTLMETLHTRTGQPILNGGAQAGAIKRILSGYTVEQAIEVLDYQLAGNWRGPVSWLSVQTQIADYFRRKEQQPQIKLGGNNGKSKLWEFCNSRPLGQF